MSHTCKLNPEAPCDACRERSDAALKRRVAYWGQVKREAKRTPEQLKHANERRAAAARARKIVSQVG